MCKQFSFLIDVAFHIFKGNVLFSSSFNLFAAESRTDGQTGVHPFSGCSKRRKRFSLMAPQRLLNPFRLLRKTFFFFSFELPRLRLSLRKFVYAFCTAQQLNKTWQNVTHNLLIVNKIRAFQLWIEYIIDCNLWTYLIK